ncbi:MAG: alpha-L-rhamnosidase N-terminal domain-containing protein [Eubacteriales bacterium]|nr:alpha-L-rhamnosidase N-terminal domain-containing protein [Eubacteriales bacterium]
MWRNAVWLGVPREEIKKRNILQGDMNGRFAYYRCGIELSDAGMLEAVITANSRYRLWINGNPVLSGPCKGDRYRHYYETVDLSSYLKKGKNVLAVQVLLCDQNAVSGQYEERAPILAVASLPGGHRLAVEGVVKDSQGKDAGTITTGKAPWKVFLDGSFFLRAGDEATANLGAVREEIDFRNSPSDWKNPDFDDSGWAEPSDMGKVVRDFEEKVGLYGSHRLEKREIPLLYEREEDFTGDLSGAFPDGEIRIPAWKEWEIILDAGVHSNAYLKYLFEKGNGAEVHITYCEKYTCPTGKEILRTDAKRGVLKGLTDKVVLNGKKVIYEPFWYRTFRFIKLHIQTKSEAVILHMPVMRKTGYPLHPRGSIKADQPWVEKLWEICVRTLQNCMMETYMDCPFYEQMQFVMDTRLQMLFNYIVSDDISLAKKAIKDFHCSMLPDGLVQGKYPSGFPQVISTFSFYYIFLLEEFYRQTKDQELLRRYRSDVDAILEYCQRHIGESGLVENLGYWQFVDWQKEWKDHMGVPTAALHGPSSIINLMYACALQSGAYIYEVTGRKETAVEYRERRKKILDGVQELCWDEEKGLYREGPKICEYTQHAQAWAVLNRMVPKEKAAEILKRTMDDPQILQCSFSTGYELFRAFEWAGIYEYTEKLLKKWIRLIDWECTTCPEEPENGRSECHAWSALPIYEFIRTMAGIRMGGDGWETAVVQPHLEYLNTLEGTTVTPKGEITFSFNKKQGTYLVVLPEKLYGELLLPSGKRTELVPGENFVREYP